MRLRGGKKNGKKILQKIIRDGNWEVREELRAKEFWGVAKEREGKNGRWGQVTGKGKVAGTIGEREGKSGRDPWRLGKWWGEDWEKRNSLLLRGRVVGGCRTRGGMRCGCREGEEVVREGYSRKVEED